MSQKCGRGRRAKGRGERGYVLITVLVLLLLIAMAGAQAFKATEQEQRGNARFSRADMLAHAADAAAAQRLAEASLATDPSAVYTNSASPSHATWTPWPTAGAGFTTIPVGQAGKVSHRSGAMRLRWAGKTPPPGFAVGTNTFIFEYQSFATFSDLTTSRMDSGEAAVHVAFKTWDTLPSSYAQ